ncbi:hypothetical protein HMPREF0379_1016 [[Eubacterium] yurii subsp. margaretiae ATCC 43715]|nr:hypothetical protein HMPREF0379_1016 [[Eubacterium] yurii subsp. margaretiae ATCC 43715]
MNIYTKILTLKGSYFVKDYEKTKKNKIQKRPILEATVLKTFKSDEDTVIVIVNQETDTVIEITPNSSKYDIRRYLGEKFVV